MTMGARGGQRLPSPTALEYESYTVRANVHPKGKVAWRAGRRVHPLPIAGHTLMAPWATAVSWPNGAPVRGVLTKPANCSFEGANRTTRFCGKYWKAQEAAQGRSEDWSSPPVVLPENGDFWRQPAAEAEPSLPASALPLRLHHYEVRSDAECARKSVLAGRGLDIFEAPKRYQLQRCIEKNAQFLSLIHI